MKYTVTFVQYHTYEVEAENEIIAEGMAYAEFRSDMRRSVAHAWYDDVEVTCEEDDEDDTDRSCETCYANDMKHDEVDNPCWNCKGNYSEWYPKET